MVFTLVGITVTGVPMNTWFVAVRITALQLSRESYMGFPSSTFIERRLGPVQPENILNIDNQ
jgi:hypothetical protein